MDKKRTKAICNEIIDYLGCIANELNEEISDYDYMNEMLKMIENDIKCVREEIEAMDKE